MFSQIVPIEKNWYSRNFDSPTLKILSPGQFLASSNSHRYQRILKLHVATSKSCAWEKTCETFFIMFGFWDYHFKQNIVSLFSHEKTLLNITHDKRISKVHHLDLYSHLWIIQEYNDSNLKKILITENGTHRSSTWGNLFIDFSGEDKLLLSTSRANSNYVFIDVSNVTILSKKILRYSDLKSEFNLTQQKCVFSLPDPTDVCVLLFQPNRSVCVLLA